MNTLTAFDTTAGLWELSKPLTIPDLARRLADGGYTVKLVSLLTMLRVYAGPYLNVLTRMHELRLLGAQAWLDCQASPDDYLDDGAKASLKWHLEQVATGCAEIELDVATRHMATVQCAMDFPGDYTYRRMQEDIKTLANLIYYEIDNKAFLFIPTTNRPYFDKPDHAFGEDVWDRFNEVNPDVRDASLCMAYEQWTAAVFHLMCVTECAIKRLADYMGLTLPNIGGMTWGQILREIDDAMAKLPKKSVELEKCSAAAAHLRNIKNAWRDPTMHGRRRYDREEAKAIFEHVKAFVNQLASEVV
jgi:hypothetical protein